MRINLASPYGWAVSTALCDLISREAAGLPGTFAHVYDWCQSYIERDQDGTLSPQEAARTAVEAYILSR